MTGQALYAPLNVDIDRRTGKPFLPEDNAIVVEEHQVETWCCYLTESDCEFL